MILGSELIQFFTDNFYYVMAFAFLNEFDNLIGSLLDNLKQKITILTTTN